MKFYIPHAQNAEQEESVYESIKKFLGDELGAKFSDRRVRYLSYKHNGKDYVAQVGKKDAIEGEDIVAILYEPLRDLYHICTPNRGVLRGSSILAGGHSVYQSKDFDAKAPDL